ncbi:MAG TPA: hypothetical protein VHZ74_23045 [Bryobacteraceae bacterium]|nr:hypothetical protein [Bryobacteraceae bacterium]
MVWYYQIVLNYTWDDVEAEVVLRNLEVPVNERQKLQDYYRHLREECRLAARAAKALFQPAAD